MNSSSRPNPAPSRDPTRRLRKASISIPLIMAVRSVAAQARETLWAVIIASIQNNETVQAVVKSNGARRYTGKYRHRLTHGSIPRRHHGYRRSHDFQHSAVIRPTGVSQDGYRSSYHAPASPYSFSPKYAHGVPAGAAERIASGATSSEMHLDGRVTCNRRGVAQRTTHAMERIITEAPCTPLKADVTPGAGAIRGHTARRLCCPDVLRRSRATRPLIRTWNNATVRT